MAALTASLLAPSLTSCDDDDDDNIKKEPEAIIREPQDHDDLEFLQANLYTTDAAGKMTAHVNGIPLDQADTTIVSIAEGTLAAAEKTFMSWLSIPERAVRTSTGYSYEMRSVSGDSIGILSFTSVNQAEGVLATLTYECNKPLPFVSEVKFLAKWPENASSPYKFNTTVQVGDYSFYCLREAADGKQGWLIGLTSPFTIAKADQISDIERRLLADRMQMLIMSRAIEKDSLNPYLNQAEIVDSVNYILRTEMDSREYYDAASFKDGLVKDFATKHPNDSLPGLLFLTFVAGSDYNSGMSGNDDLPGAGGSTSEDGINAADAPQRRQ